MSDTREPLWAVHVQGPDDLVPVASYADALALACTFNDWWREHKARKPLTENDPRMWAVPVQYDGTADAHAEWVKNPSPDYAPFFATTNTVKHTPDARGWLDISTRPQGVQCIFYSPGNPKAWNENAREPHMRIDTFSEKWASAHHQYPEAPYTHWMPLPPAPQEKGGA